MNKGAKWYRGKRTEKEEQNVAVGFYSSAKVSS